MKELIGRKGRCLTIGATLQLGRRMLSQVAMLEQTDRRVVIRSCGRSEIGRHFRTPIPVPFWPMMHSRQVSATPMGLLGRFTRSLYPIVSSRQHLSKVPTQPSAKSAIGAFDLKNLRKLKESHFFNSLIHAR